ncbi:MAG: hypothetical protein MHMPM18_002595 [Marteilia pararefringens]
MAMSGRRSRTWSNKRKSLPELKSDSSKVCRICLDSEMDSSLKVSKLCKCQGSIANVHVSCIERWVNDSKNERCEICGEKLDLKKTTASICAWFKAPATRYERRLLFADVLCFTIVGPFSIFVSLFCLKNAAKIDESSKSERAIFIISGLSIIAITILWTGLGLFYHIKAINRWRRQNSSVSVY